MIVAVGLTTPQRHHIEAGVRIGAGGSQSVRLKLTVTALNPIRHLQKGEMLGQEEI